MDTHGSETTSQDTLWMKKALDLAQHAEQEGEVPIGAVLVYQGQSIGQGWNQNITLCDPTAHAEIQALRQAAQTLRNHRLTDTTLYTTLEPCIMCLGAMMHARITRLVFSAQDPKINTVHHILSNHASISGFNHHISWQGGVLADISTLMLQQFFQKRRPYQDDVL